jgi:hypothetical protein
MIRMDEKVSAVLARDARLVEVFVAASPAFQRLRNPALRRVMTRLVTVEQAARVAGVDARHLLAELNRALAAPGGVYSPGAGPAQGAPHPDSGAAPSEDEAAGGAKPPSRTAAPAIPAERIIDLDVREDLRNGREPFSRIMAARRAIPSDGALCVRAIFEPIPLYDVMARHGLDHFSEKLADDDWRVWFFPADAHAAEAAGTQAGEGPG